MKLVYVVRDIDYIVAVCDSLSAATVEKYHHLDELEVPESYYDQVTIDEYELKGNHR